MYVSTTGIFRIKKKFDVKGMEYLQKKIERYPASKIHIRLGFFLAKVLLRFRVTPNQVTFIRVVVTMFSAAFFSIGDLFHSVVGVALLHISWTLDFTDGQLARTRRMMSKFGMFLDPIADWVGNFMIYIGIIFGGQRQYENEFIWIIGFMIPLGLFMNNYCGLIRIDNDVLEKFSQRLSNHPKNTDIKGNNRNSYLSSIKTNIEKYPIIVSLFMGFRKSLDRFSKLILEWDIQVYVISIFALLNNAFLAILLFCVNYNYYWLKFILNKYKYR